MSLLKEVKMLKGIKDDLQDDVLKLIITESQSRILTRMNLVRKEKLKEVPKELDWIVRDVAIKRFNRLNAEGTTKKQEEGSSFDWEGYLDEYAAIFDSYTDSEKTDKSSPGIVRVW